MVAPKTFRIKVNCECHETHCCTWESRKLSGPDLLLETEARRRKVPMDGHEYLVTLSLLDYFGLPPPQSWMFLVKTELSVWQGWPIFKRHKLWWQKDFPSSYRCGTHKHTVLEDAEMTLSPAWLCANASWPILECSLSLLSPCLSVQKALLRKRRGTGIMLGKKTATV